MNKPNLIYSTIVRKKEESVINHTDQGQLIQAESNIYIERVKQLKREILNGVAEPTDADFVQPEIIESWIRSRNYGLETYQSPCTSPVISEIELDNLLNENRIFINATLSSLQQVEPLLNDNYDILLADPNGVNLLTMLGKNNDISYEKFNLVPGSVWNEQTIGTSAMSLAAVLKRPIQVCGPEIYFDDFQAVASSSAPIFDIKGNLAGILSIATFYYQYINVWHLSLAASLAELIEKELKLTFYEEMYKTTHDATDEAMITIDSHGYITYTNQAAVSLFQPGEDDLIGRSAISLLGKQAKIKKVTESGKALPDTDMAIPNFGKYRTSIYPIKEFQGQHCGCLVAIKRGKIVHAPINNDDDAFAAIIGSSAPIKKTVSLARRFAECESNVLLQGESGTGKELFARGIHSISRPDAPFVAVNCGAISRTLAESELFGYEGGSFTGAKNEGRQGKIEYADQGTLFLDEIGDLPLDLQPMLLRVLEEKKVVRVGGNRSIQVDFQLIAASNKDLLNLMEKGLLREDLYYRLAVFKIVIPPLRDREQDILILSDYFLSAYAQKRGIPSPRLNRAAKNILIQYSWPGNVRQLEHCLTYAASISDEGVIRPENLPEEIQFISLSGKEETEFNPEMENIRQALQKSGHNVSDAARFLGISRSTLYRKIKKYGL